MITAVAVIFCMSIAGIGPDTAFAADDDPAILASGECGLVESVTWTLYKDGTLRLSGAKATVGQAWQDYRKRILKVVVDEGITSLGYNSFEECVNLKEVDLPESLVQLCDYAFSNCSSLEEIYLPDRTLGFGQRVFNGCEALKTVRMSENLTLLGEGMFYNCKSLDNIVIPSGTEVISKAAFAGCTSLKNVTIPEGVTKISAEAFVDCMSLTDIDLPSSLQTIGNYAFLNTRLKTVETPDNTREIGEYAFAYCDDLQNVQLNEGLDEIGGWAFAYCPGLNWVDLPESVTWKGEEIFHSSYDIGRADISIPDDRVYTGSAFTPGPTVTFQGHGLTEGTDYEVSHEISADERSIIMRVTGINNFFNQQEFTFDNPNYVEPPSDPGDNGDDQDPGDIGTEPSPGDNTEPGSDAGTDSGSTEPTEPNPGDNTDPGNSEPADPGMGDNSDAGSDKPMEPVAEDKTDTGSDKTTEPVTEDKTDVGSDKNTEPVTEEKTDTGSDKPMESVTEDKTDVGKDAKTDTQKKEEGKAVTSSIDIRKANISGIKDMTYTGSYLKPRPVITYKGQKLVKGKDYKLTYANNKKAGTATVTATGINKYRGSVNANFNIRQAVNKITLKQKSVTVAYGKKADLSKYASSVSKLHFKSKNTSVATVTNTGIVKFKHPGTVKIRLTSGGTNYEKKTKTITVTSRLASPKLKVKRGKGKAKLTWTKVTKATAYQIYIRYPGKKSYVLALTKPSKVKSVTHRGLSKKKTYRYKVRAAIKINGKWYYSRYSSIVKIKAK